MVYFKTDVGRKRENNEDFAIEYALDEETHVYIVLDGIGGESGGEIASKVAANKTIEYIKEHYHEKNTEGMLRLAVKYANKCINELAKENKAYKNMGTTISLVYISGNIGYVISVGDSRVYEVKENELVLLTEDDTYVNALLKDNIISKDEAKVHPERHVLVRAIGVARTVNFDVIKIEDVTAKRFLLCTDGLTGMVQEAEIFNIITNSNKDKICNKLIDAANENGGADNVTVMYVEV